jgi:hypothetical protein
MSALPPPAGPLVLARRLPVVLREIAALIEPHYPGLRLAVTGEHPTGDPMLGLHLPIPAAEPAVDALDVPLPVGLDGAVEGVRREMPRRFEGLDYAYIGGHFADGKPDFLLVIPLTPPTASPG